MSGARRWNTLLGGGPMPPHARIDNQWCKKIERAVLDRGLPVEVEHILYDYVSNRAVVVAGEVADELGQELSLDLTAVIFHRIAESIATPPKQGRDGRPVGLHTHDLNKLNKLKADVLRLEDGSDLGRPRAIAAAVATEAPESQPALKRWLNRHLPPLQINN